MAYLSLYRKYRPRTFEELVGQKHVARTLKNAISADKVAHAYLFSGPRGTGKTSTARLLAKALNCESGPTATPDDTCEMCKAISAGTAMDVVEMDAASNRGIDEIRALRERIHFAPAQGTYKVYIVDEVHMLTPEAFNALLKALEEPPEHTIFVLCTTDPHKVPPTIASRCQRFDFRRLSLPDVVGRLTDIAKTEGINVDETGLKTIARSAQGSLRDAISTLDQLSAFGDKAVSSDDIASLLGVVEQELLFDLAGAVADGDPGGALRLAAQAVEEGHDPASVMRELLGHFRNLYVTCAVGDAPGVLDVTPETHRELVDQGGRFNELALERVLSDLSQALVDLRGAPDARLVMETALVHVAKPPAGPAQLAERMADLERRLEDAGRLAGAPPVEATVIVETAPADGPEAEVADRDEPEPVEPEPAEVEAIDSEPEPVEAEPVQAAEATTEGIQRNWSAFLKAVGDPRLAGPLRRSDAQIRDGELFIAVADESSRELLEAPAKLQALQTASETVFGEPIPVKIEVGGKPVKRREVRHGENGVSQRMAKTFDAEKVQEIRRQEGEPEARET